MTQRKRSSRTIKTIEVPVSSVQDDMEVSVETISNVGLKPDTIIVRPDQVDEARAILNETEHEPVVEYMCERTPRLLLCAKGAYPRDESQHTAWELYKDENIRKAQQKGYRSAKESDIFPDHDGYLDAGGLIRKGDTVLMICPREIAEKREMDRLGGLEELNRSQHKVDEKAGLIADDEQHYQRRGSKIMSIP